MVIVGKERVGVRGIPGLKIETLRLRSVQALGHPLCLGGSDVGHPSTYKGAAKSGTVPTGLRLLVG